MSKSTQKQDNLNSRLQAPEAERSLRGHLHLFSTLRHFTQDGKLILGVGGGGGDEHPIGTVHTQEEANILPQTQLFCCYHFFFLHLFAILNFLHSLRKECFQMKTFFCFQMKAWVSLPTHSRKVDHSFVEIAVKKWMLTGPETCLTSDGRKRGHSSRGLAGELPLAPAWEACLRSGAHTFHKTGLGFLRNVQVIKPCGWGQCSSKLIG